MSESERAAGFPTDASPDARLELERSWAHPRGFLGWFTEVHHARIARRSVITAFVFFAFAGLEAVVMRLQLARPGSTLVGPDRYDQLFSMHGSTMMFLFAVPVMEAMGLWMVPSLIGTRNLAFPRLIAWAYYLFLIGGVLLYTSFALGFGVDTGWFSYVPLSGPEFAAGKRVDTWAQMITFTELSGLAMSVSMIVTILKQRAPGMSLARMPLFAWSQLVTAFMVLFAMPAVMLGSGMLASDRMVGTHFFNPVEGGDPLLWQHLFWFFAHPEVYIIFIPALGMVSMIVSTFARRPIFGYPAMVLSLVATGFIGFGLWVHHMFATDVPEVGQSFFTAASIVIAVPTGVQLYCWIATLWGAPVRFTVPLLHVLAFFGVFVLGGLSGVMLASVPLDLQLHDTFFVVAHLHFVLIGGSLFPLFGAITYWFPKWTGRFMNERLGRWQVALMFVGFIVTFLPMHQLGILGMPRRIYTYSADRGWGSLNMAATIGAGVLGVSMLLMLINVAWSARRGARVGPDPWGGGTLEWTTSSPPPPYGFVRIPAVRSGHPLWTDPEVMPCVAGLRTDRREVLVTRVLDAEPDHRSIQPGPSPWPVLLAAATGVTFIGLIFHAWFLPIGSLLCGAVLVAWFWPKKANPHEPEESKEKEFEDELHDVRERRRA
jgi:cytochrome c oxidase subunit I+III